MTNRPPLMSLTRSANASSSFCGSEPAPHSDIIFQWMALTGWALLPAVSAAF